ncbi:OmpA family protein [Pelobacter propionicus]|uniref:OmpA/MotB domain protein n=1 Tax=Pelobacter propionicus (strain DSM 2379 / NBRC 103807 / OttBd1) TaxID=338966 RepID=A1AUP2_PELPD|nr:OmpA family protein [Pelobacter propionicus]ABL01063.1 OmpA/MotB domain protein [Pelobacter propionicus DSM 2379]
MARKKEPEKHVNHERWLVSYADFITLLFAVFVTLYAMSQSDKKKTEEVMQSIQQSFGMVQAGAPSPKMNILPSSQMSITPSIKPEVSVMPGSRGARGMVKTRATEKDFRQIKSSIEAYLVKQGAQSKVNLTITRRGLIVSLKEAGFFDSGQAQIKPTAYELINTIAEVMTQYSNPLRLEGHTDNVPINTSQFPSNWELSTARAVNGLKYLIRNFGVDPDKISVAGYAEFRPMADNATPEGRAKNRRVDLVMLSNEGERGEPENSSNQPKPE